MQLVSVMHFHAQAGQLQLLVTKLLSFLAAWARLFKTNDIVSKRDIKFSNVPYVKCVAVLCWKKVRNFLQCKSSTHFFSKKYETS